MAIYRAEDILAVRKVLHEMCRGDLILSVKSATNSERFIITGLILRSLGPWPCTQWETYHPRSSFSTSPLNAISYNSEAIANCLSAAIQQQQAVDNATAFCMATRKCQEGVCGPNLAI